MLAALPWTGRFPKPTRNNDAKADIHNGTNTDIHNGMKVDIYAKTSEKQTFILTGVAVEVGGGGAKNCIGTPDVEMSGF